MNLPEDYKPVKGTEHNHPPGHKALNPTAGNEPVTATVILRRRVNGPKLRELDEFSPQSKTPPKKISRSEFAADYGADPKEMEQVASFAKSHGLEVVESHPGRRSVVVRGSASAMGKAFAVELHDYDSPRGKYHGHTGTVNLPGALADLVEAVIGLDNRLVPAQHFSTARRQNPSDPPNTNPLTPPQVAQLYNFPAGDGTGQTIGIYEMETQDAAGNPAPAGYTVQDLTDSIKAFGGNLKVPQPVDVPVDGVNNSGPPTAKPARHHRRGGDRAEGDHRGLFRRRHTQNMIHALQQMIHPAAGAPAPDIISISYGWGPDDPGTPTSPTGVRPVHQPVRRRRHQTDHGVSSPRAIRALLLPGPRQAQVTYPSTDIWVTSCGGTTIGNVNGAAFDEYVWNDGTARGRARAGGGVSARFLPPRLSERRRLPRRAGNRPAGQRRARHLAGNASENSGYLQFINGTIPACRRHQRGGAALCWTDRDYQRQSEPPVGFLNALLYAPMAYSTTSMAPRDRRTIRWEGDGLSGQRRVECLHRVGERERDGARKQFEDGAGGRHLGNRFLRSRLGSHYRAATRGSG